MRAKKLNEFQEFKRGQGTTKAIGVGKWSEEAQAEQRNEFENKLFEIGITGSWRVASKGNDIWKFQFENRLGSNSARTNMIMSDYWTLWYTRKTEYYADKIAPTINENILEDEPFIFVKWDYGDQEILKQFKTADEAIKFTLEKEYEDSEEWNYLEIMEKIINILKGK